MTEILVVAPHPDDETISSGGTLLRHIQERHAVHWLIITRMTREAGYSDARIAVRALEIERVSKAFGMTSVEKLEFATSELDAIKLSSLVSAVAAVVRKIKPTTVYMPFPGDAHSDHRAVFRAVAATTKWFRYPSVKRLLAYETLSETNVGIDPTERPFQPNVFVDISQTLERKLEILQMFEGEIGPFPFPRSLRAVRALAELRGASSGFEAAEAFMLLREHVSFHDLPGGNN
jgi:LmbE family N-acetylglucosaminyl deacetylase